ncbi:MAG: hypothetical protein KGJ73_12500 [Rhodospirillales bacterium]|nr:hypothetical protein [Rhodospirillales bacterium]
MTNLKAFWRYPIHGGPGLRLLAIAALLLSILPVPAFAQDTQKDIINTASLSLVPLPAEAIATIKGGSLQVPSFNGAASPAGGITLWDELKPLVKTQNELDGVSVVTINGTAK